MLTLGISELASGQKHNIVMCPLINYQAPTFAWLSVYPLTYLPTLLGRDRKLQQVASFVVDNNFITMI